MVITVGRKHPFNGQIGEGVFLMFAPLLAINGMPGVTDKEAAAFSNGRIDLSLQEVDGVGCITMAVEGLGESQGLFGMGRGVDFLEKPSEDPRRGYLISLLLIDSRTQIVRSLRAVGVSQDFSLGLYGLWLKLRDQVLSDTEFEWRVRRILARYPSFEEMEARAPYRYTVKAKTTERSQGAQNGDH